MHGWETRMLPDFSVAVCERRWCLCWASSILITWRYRRCGRQRRPGHTTSATVRGAQEHDQPGEDGRRHSGSTLTDYHPISRSEHVGPAQKQAHEIGRLERARHERAGPR